MKTVMIVEGDADLLSVTRDILESAGFDVLACRDAETAITVIVKEGVRPDALVTSYLLPGMNGGQFLAKLQTVLSRVIPTVMVSTMIPPITGFFLGVRSFLRKPYDCDEFIRSVESAANGD